MDSVDAPAPTAEGLSRRDLLRRGGAVGGALLWVAPALQVLDLGAASADSQSGLNPKDLPEQFECIVKVVERYTCHTGGKRYVLPYQKTIGVKYDPTQGWVIAPNGSGSGTCLSMSYGTDAGVLADFKSALHVGQVLFGGKSTFIFQLPSRYKMLQAKSKKPVSLACTDAPHFGNIYYFQGN